MKISEKVMKDDRDGNFIIPTWPLLKTKSFNIVNVGLALRSSIHLFGIALSVTRERSLTFSSTVLSIQIIFVY